ncbi:dihydroceramide fatty acyl 2-hydroxylase FAH1 isoform X2 [Gossypium hirsutum]|uniref:Dihydroceramide fatty acyl 2-hydroxylase FAH1 isoform X2 n=1 Tax=Gossypium hirsutum TaxID=3635 RepID=A0ABM3BX96_GOSHI|nr:dihydroceramide fatty acyl 2-hydroxylase FAH1-like isoform X2 [Gossypium hirsutum]
MVSKPFAVDLNKPIVFQVGHLGEAYEKWVHQPIVTKDGPRFFANDFCELLTRTKWWVIPLVWLPVVCWLVCISTQRGLTPTEAALAVVGGIFIWTLLEYCLHRFLFHIKTRSYWLRNFAQGKHLSLSTSWLPSQAPFGWATPCFSPSRYSYSVCAAPALFGGGLLGYVTYDCTHYYLHHGKPSKGYGQILKRYHLNHHFKVQNKGFGITSSIWDHVFGTFPATQVSDISR